MALWPSTDPDDYGTHRHRLALTVDRAPEPPYRWMIARSLVGGGVITAVAFALGAPGGWQLLLVLSGATWVSRSHVTRWWQSRHGYRRVSWVPASTFAVAATLIGLVVTASVANPHERGTAVYVWLLVGWFGGDALDWVLLKRSDRAGPGA